MCPRTGTSKPTWSWSGSARRAPARRCEAAAAGGRVLVLDRFDGGGATALSGGVVYAGGGTPQQRAAGVSDSAEAMFRYLRDRGRRRRAAPATLREFCDGSTAMLAWLEGHGVPFEGSLCPDKTSYPTNRHYLYYSGSELSARDVAPPAPRGHRALGRGTSGGLLYARLAAAVRRAGVEVVRQTAAVRLITADGRVTGVECRSLRGAPVVGAAPRTALLHRAARKPYLYVPKLGRVMHRPADWLERRYARTAARRGRPRRGDRGRRLRGEPADAARPRAVRPRRPAAGHAGRRRQRHPARDRGRGSDRAAWTGSRSGASSPRRPPWCAACWSARDGKRICDESRYGAAIGDAIVRGGGQAWLLVDRPRSTAARRQVRGSTLWFQRLQAWYLLCVAPVTAATVAGVATRAGVDPDGLAATVAAYNAAACNVSWPIRAGAATRWASRPTCWFRWTQPPYSLIDFSIRPRMLDPAPVLTLGGLVVAPETGAVLQADGTPVPGLYAAGRSAVGPVLALVRQRAVDRRLRVLRPGRPARGRAASPSSSPGQPSSDRPGGQPPGA